MIKYIMAYFKTTIDMSNPVWLNIQSNNDAVAHVLNEKFCFEVPNARFTPAYKRGTWDGWIRLFNRRNGTIYTGLISDIYRELKQAGVGDIEIINRPQSIDVTDEFLRWLENQELPFEPDKEQIDAALECLNGQRRTILSPTSSGKTFIIYLVLKFQIDHNLLGRDKKILCVVDSVTLLDQMYNDFIEYGMPEEHLHRIRGEKIKPTVITISTWQSIYKLESYWYDEFETVIVDEVHKATADGIKGILEKCYGTIWRIGFTGTLRDGLVNELIIKGLFGKVIRTTTTKELMDKGRVAKLTINFVKFCYSRLRKERQSFFKNKLPYQDEIKFLHNINSRDEALFKLLDRHLESNILILFRFIKHGRRLADKYTKHNPNCEVFVIDGSVSPNERNRMKQAIEDGKSIKLFASFGTTSTGVSIKNLHIGIFASPIKSKITVLQAIGRLLRMNAFKDSAIFYDICDELKLDGKLSYSEKHAEERLDRYLEEEFKIIEEKILV